MNTNNPPRQLLVPTHANAGNDLELINDLQQLGWEVSKEHRTDSQVVYNVYDKPENELKGRANFRASNALDDGRGNGDQPRNDEGEFVADG